MDSINRLREKYERKIQALENKERILCIVKWVLAAIATAAFLFGVVKVVLLAVERISKKKVYVDPEECLGMEELNEVIDDEDLEE